MIRINLHPVRQMKKAQAGKRQLLIFGLIVVGEIAAMGLLYSWRAGAADEKRQQIAQLTSRIEQLKKEVGDFDQLRAQRDRLIAQRNIINALQKARTGPVRMMREFAEILTKGKGPTVNQTEYEALLRRDPAAGYNPRWDSNRLWLDSISESRGMVRLAGKAKDYDDVAEFTRRVGLSRYFKDEFLERNDQVYDGKAGTRVVRFRLRARVVF